MASKGQPPPEPIPQSTVLALQAWKDKYKINNANWETVLNQAVTVNPADSVFVKASFIDTRGTASGNIDLAVDTEISLEYYFYWIHNFNACDSAELIATPTTPDASNNLNQQVLVGPDIASLYAYNKVIDPSGGTAVPAYMCDPSGNFQATGINDADGLPYLVYQSSDVIPVPAVLGPVIPASDIVVGTSYVVNTQGLTTNWSYAGIFNSSKNVLPASYELDITPFTATANPNGVDVPALLPLYTNPGMNPFNFLLPANVNPTLPYVSYMITFVGNTDWVAIDPNLVSTYISASQMVAGTEYAIDNPGNLNWVALGAANNLSDTEFVYTPPPNAPPDFPITLNNAFFLANAAAYTPDTGLPFGASANDLFECVIGVDGTGNYTLVSYSGSGSWCYNIGATAQWNLPPALFGVSTAVCPTATPLIITGFSATSDVVPVASLVAGDNYTVATTGVLDGSNPPFTWNMVSNLPTTDTSLMVSGNQYQVYEYNDVVIPYAPNQGVLTDVFISQGAIAIEPISSLLYDTPATPNIYTVVTITVDGVAVPMNINWVISLNVTADANGNCQINFANEDGLLYNTIDAPPFATAQTIITTINGSAIANAPPINVSFISTAADNDFDSTTITNFRQTATLVPFPQNTVPSKLVQLQSTTPLIFTASGSYTGTGSTSTANLLFGTLTAATVSGTGYLQGSVYNTAPKVGTIVQSLFPDPGTPPSPAYLEFATEITQNLFEVVKVYLDGVLFNWATADNPTITLIIIADVNGNCAMNNAVSNINVDSNWLTGVKVVTTTIDDSINGGTLPLLTFTSTGAQINVPNSEVVGFTSVAPFVPYPFNFSTGRAVEYPTPNPYDGTVRQIITPATTRLDIRPVKKKWAMTIPRGSYNPNYLAELISRNMSRQKVKRVYNVKGGPFGTQASLTVPTDNIYNNQSSPPLWAQTTGGGANTFYDSKNPAAYNIPSDPNYNLLPDNADDMPFLFTPAMNSSVLNTNTSANPTGAQNNYIYAEIPHPNANGLNNLPPPTFYVNLVPLCNDVYSVSPTIKSTTPYYSILPFYTQNSAVTDGASNSGNSGVFPIVFGANQTSLLYNNENNGLFSFNYLHSPMYAFLSSGTADLTEVTGHMYTTQKVSTNMTSTNFFTTLVDKNSGILLNQMNPPSFWEQLGFNINALTVDLDGPKIGYQMKLAEFQAKTTGGFCGSSNIFNPTFHTANSAAQPSCPDTELVYTTAVPAAIQPSDIITAYRPNLTIGTSYKVYYPGKVASGGDPYIENDWTPVGGPLVDTGVNMAGTIFTATSTGFDPDNPPNGVNWKTDPTVVLADLPITTNTQLQTTYFQVENTNVLNAATIPTVRESTGHYLVEITGYNSNYIDNESKYEIKAIVSAYWVSAGSFVSVPFPDSYNFFGTGAPITLSGLKVRILDPFTMKEPVIGPNSSIYLQINKMLSEQAVAQIPN